MSKPAFEGYAYAGGVVVKVTAAEGVLPKGATVQAAPVERQDVVEAVSGKIEGRGKELKDAVAIDVTLLDENGSEIQPDGALNVCFFDANVEGSEIGVYRVSDDASRVEAIGTRQADPEVQSFDVDHFTIYVVAGDDEIYQAPEGGKLIMVNFVYPSGAMAEKSFGEGAMPDANGTYGKFSHEFDVPMGYTASLSEDSEAAGFELAGTGSEFAVSVMPTTDGPETLSATIVFTPNKVEYAVVHKYPKIDGVQDQLNASEGQELTEDEDFYSITEKATGDFGSATDAVTCPQEGFSLSEVHNSAIDSESGIVAEVLYERNTHSVQYDTMGGSYVKAGTVPHKGTLELPEGASAPTREGYEFAGWYGSQECEGEALTVLTNVTEGTTLYAKWAPAEVSYRVIFWAENANDENYSNMGSDEMRAVAGSDTDGLADESALKASFTQLMGKDPFNRNEADYYHFDAFSSDDATVAADGSTVVNAYFDRNVYALEFVYGFEDASGRYVWTSTEQWSNSGGTNYARDGKARIISDANRLPDPVTIEAKYGADISAEWPTTAYRLAGNDFISWATVKGSGYYQVNNNNKNIKGTYSTMSAELILDPANAEKHHVMHAYWNNGSAYTYSYYVESLGATGDREYRGKQYDLVKSESIRSTATGAGQNALGFPHLVYNGDAAGKEYVSPASAGAKGGRINFYYSRESYTVTYYNGNTESSRPALYQTVLTEDEYGTSPSECPYKKGAKDWEFEGWYLDDAGIKPMEWGAEEGISSNVTVYAKWKAPEYEVIADLNYEGAADPTTQMVEEGGTAVLGKPADRPGYVFGGWYADKACTEEFDANAPISDTVTAYAKWDKIKNISYTVSYVDDQGKPLADGRTATGLVGSTVTEKAPNVDGYVANKGSDSIVLDVDADKNAITFVYSKVESYQYRVQYAYRDKAGNEYRLDSNGDTWIDTKLSTVNVLPDEEIVASLVGYTLQDQYKTVKLYADKESNVVTFYMNANEYALTYEGVDDARWGDGTVSVNPNPSTYTTHDTVGIVNPVRPGYTFAGWIVSSTSDKELVGSAEDPLNVVISKGSRGHLTLTAQWRSNEAEVSVWFYGSADDSPAYFIDTDGKLVETGKNKYSASIDTERKNGYSESALKGYADEAYALTPELDRYGGYEIRVAHRSNEGAWDTIANLESYDIQDGDEIRYYIIPDVAHAITYAAGDHGVGDPFVESAQYFSGDQVTARTVLDGTGISAAAGYKFKGWATNDADVSGAGSFIMPAKDVTFTALWNQLLSVTYAWDGLPDEGTHLYDKDGNPVATPTLPPATTGLVEDDRYAIDAEFTNETVYYTHDDYGNVNGSYAFSGWDPAPGSYTMGAEDVRVTGTWEAKSIEVRTYDVTYEYSGSIPANAPALPGKATYVPNQPVAVEAAPRVDGYTFSGWTTADVAVSEDSFAMPDQDVTIVGAWTANQDTAYTVERYLQNLDGTYPQTATYIDAETQGVTDEIAYADTAVSYEGFTFAEGYEGNVLSGTITAGPTKLVLRVYYERDSYDVTYKVTGSFFANDAYHVDASVRFGTPLSLIGDSMDQQGYVWSEWSGLPASMPASSVTVTGFYTAASDTRYTVRHLFQDVEGDGYSPRVDVPDEFMTGTTGELTSAGAKTLKGFTANNFEQQPIAADGTTIIEIRYERTSYNVVGTVDAHGAILGNANQNIRYQGASEALVFEAENGYRIASIVINGRNVAVPPGMTAYTFAAIESVEQHYTVDVRTAAIGSIAVVGPSDSKTYDGTPLVPGTPIVSGLPDGFAVEYKVSGGQTDAGSSATTVTDIGVRDADGNDVTSNYTVESLPGTLTVNPAAVTITVDDASKVVGTNDPAFTGTPVGLAAEGDLGDISYVRSGDDEGVGVYTDVLTALYEPNANYAVTVLPGTFTITAAPVAPAVPPTDTPAPAGTTPGTVPPDSPLAPVVTPIVDALAGAAEAVIGDNGTPLAQGETDISDNGTPLAGGDRVSCWVHLYIILGIIVTVVYGVCVATRRSLFSRKLKKYENDLTGGGDPAPGSSSGKENGAAAGIPKRVPASAVMAAGLGE